MISAPLCVLLGNRWLTGVLSLVVCWLRFGISVWLLSNVVTQGPVSYERGGWKAPYGIVYVVDHLSAFVMLFVSGLAAIVLTYAPPSTIQKILRSRPRSYPSSNHAASIWLIEYSKR